MTLFTASGLLWGQAEGSQNYAECLYRAYLRWLYTQTGEKAVDGGICKRQAFEKDDNPWILDVRELYACRAPGLTCLSCLEEGRMGTVDKPVNDSKGCGGVMRVAPVGLFFRRSLDEAFRIGAEAAAITHGHPSGYLPAGAFAAVIAGITQGMGLEEAVNAALGLLPRWEGHEETSRALALALELAKSPLAPKEAVTQLGEGWVGEEALAMAVYCALAEKDVQKALLLSVNHAGDSDSTGAICGNLLGALYGEEAFPAEWRKNVELGGYILAMAERLYRSLQ